MIIFKHKIFNLFLLLFIVGAVTLLLLPLPTNIEYSKAVYSSDSTLLSAYLTSGDKWRLKTNINDVSPKLVKAIVQKEDKWFFWHLGVNPISVFRAFIQNISSGQRVSGASTITMQVAKMLSPSERSYTAKLLEMIRALQLELKYSKNEILEMYLSLLPMGGNIEGIKSASYIYFNKPENHLSLAQAISLMVIPKDPNNLRIDVFAKKNLVRRNYWIKKFQEVGLFSEIELQDAKNEPLYSNRYKVPNKAPQFSLNVISKSAKFNYYSSLNLTIQNKVERLLKNYVESAKSKNVNNGSVLVIDNITQKVVAYCGSSDFYDSTSAGQVDGITAIRSPGSTLKPGLYALAFDNGILTPNSTMLDIPTDFAGYEPENYDEKFRGMVTAEFALRNSLNIPAVDLLNKVGLQNYIELLSRCSFTEISQQKKRLGLSLILGGCGTSLWQLTNLFSTFAKKGIYNAASFENDNPISSGQNIFSEASCYLIANILSKNERPDFPAEFIKDTKLAKFAWKTGTSFGKKDAWAIGFNKKYSIGVWLGNFSGKGSPYLTGASMAVPLLFKIFNSINIKHKKEWFPIPQKLGARMVCKNSGMLPSNNCTDLVEDYYIMGKSNNKICDFEKAYYINTDSTETYCTECIPANKYKKVYYPNYSAELIYYFKSENIPYKHPPHHNLNCKALGGSNPIIISPLPDYEYYISKSSKEEISLEASSKDGNSKYYWYINDKFYKISSPNNKVFFSPKREKNKITCVDEQGNSSEIIIRVKFY